MNADAHLRILTGDLIVKIAIVSAENDALKDQNDVLTAQLAAAAPYLPKPKTPKTTMPT